MNCYVSKDNLAEQVIDCGCECKCDLTKVPVSLQLAVVVGYEAVEEDYNKNYKNATRLYKESEQWFLRAINDEKSDQEKDHLRKYCKKYMDRVEKLKPYVDERRRMNKLRELRRKQISQAK